MQALDCTNWSSRRVENDEPSRWSGRRHVDREFSGTKSATPLPAANHNDVFARHLVRRPRYVYKPFIEGLSRRISERPKYGVHPRLIARPLTLEPLKHVLVETQ